MSSHLQKFDNDSDSMDSDDSKIADEHLQAINLKQYVIDGDGNCVFSAIAHMLQTRMHWCTATKNHLLAAGIPEPRADQLRYMFVNKFLERKRDYENQFGQTFKREDIEIYLQDGMYNTNVGDFVLLVLVNILKLPITAVTPFKSCPLLPIIPKKSISDKPLYVAFIAHNNHYNAVQEDQHTTIQSSSDPSFHGVPSSNKV